MANASPLTLMTSPLSVTNQTVTPFGMLGGLVPVTMPFQFPLELLGFGTDTAGVTTTSGSTSAAFHHSLTQSKWGSVSNVPSTHISVMKYVGESQHGGFLSILMALFT